MFKYFHPAISVLLLVPFLFPADQPNPSNQISEDINDVVTSTTKREVEIGLMYNGDHIYFFGNVPDAAADVIVKLVSTDDVPMSVNRKGKVALMWMNVKQFTVTGLPLLYKLHSTRPINQILSASAARELGIGYDILREQMQLELVSGRSSPDDRETIFNGVLQLKKESNLYNVDEKRIEITGGKLFKHYFRFPSAAKEGTYRAESYIFKNGELVGKGVDEIVIRKTGIEAQFTNLAFEHPAIYGAIAVLVALCMGLLVGFIFKKGGGH